MPIDTAEIASLDAYSREFAELCFARHPEWREAAWAELEDGDEEPHLVIQFSAPDERGFDLELSTYAGEATLSADFWHAHASTLTPLPGTEGHATSGGAMDGDDPLDAASEALLDEAEALALIQLTESLLADKRGLWVRFEDGDFHSSGLIESPAAEAALERSLKPGTHLRIRVHSGRRSRQLGKGPAPEL